MDDKTRGEGPEPQIDPHAVPDADPAGTEAVHTPVAAETGTAPRHGAAHGRAATDSRGRDAADPRRQEPEQDDDDKLPLGYAIKRALRGFSLNHLTDLAASLTYYAVLAVAPALVALVSILGVVGNGPQIVDGLLDVVEDLGSKDAVEAIQPILEQVTSSPAAGIALITGLLIALWSASGYVTAFSRASNRIYDVIEGRPIWKLRPMMYLLTLILVILVALAAVMLVASGSVARSIGDVVGLSGTAVTVWNIAKWPAVVLVALIAIALLYGWTPNVRQRKFRLISWGAVVAIVVWAIVSVGFGFYVANFGNYESTYGTLAGVVIFLLWLWISNLALLFGAQLEAELERGRQLQEGIIAEEQIQLPPRDTAASDKRAAKERKEVEEGRQIRES